MDIKKILNFSKKPQLFERSETVFWDDPHISQQMLEAHLNPDWDAASRKLSTIDKSVKWLDENIFLKKDLEILDLGCGPGLYASRLAKLGYSLTGIDYSRRSIDYARKYAEENQLDIEYIYQNYLTIDYQSRFDVIMLIYCDLGALTDAERDILLEKIYQALKPGGLFIFDVFTDRNRDESEQGRSWEVVDKGFWSDRPHLALSETFFYPEADTYMEQTLVMTEDNQLKIYRIFDHFYTKTTAASLLTSFGFKDHSFFTDLTGKEYSEEAKTIAVITKK